MPKSKTRRRAADLALMMSLTVGGGTARAYEVTDTLDLNGLLSGAGQCQEITGGTPLPTICRGGVVLQAEALYHPTDQDQFFVKLEVAGWNGLSKIHTFVLSPWATGLEAGTLNINGSNRNYLFEAWYAHTFEFSATNSVQITGGIIDPSLYVDKNAFANDEYTQFMNEVFVNSHNGFMPNYDWGGAAVWTLGPWTLSGVGTNITKNEDGYNYNWFAAEVEYKLGTRLGEGHYRLMYAGTSRAFLSPTPTAAADPNADPTATPMPDPIATKERRAGLVLSCDQELGEVLGVFLRLGLQTRKALVDYGSEYSGGFNFKGIGWGRERDNIGLGLAHLQGGNSDIARTNVFETYYRLGFNDRFSLSADVQYMQDQYRAGTSTDGWIFGLRADAAF